MTTLKYLICYIAISSMSFMSVAQSNNPLKQNFSYLYDYDATDLHPQFSVFNFSPDSSRLFVKVFPGEFVFKKVKGTSEMNCQVELAVYYDWELKQLADSTSITFSDAASQDPNRFLIATLDFKSDEFKSTLLEISVIDVYGDKVYMRYIPCSPNKLQSPNSFFAQNNYDNLPLLQPYAASGDSLAFFARNDHPKGVRVRYFENDFPVAAPPAQKGAFKKYNYATGRQSIYDFETTGYVTLPDPGLYHFQYDTLQKTGFTVFRFDDNYPKVRGLKNMMECMRYLVTKEEYDKMLSETNEKSAFEKFWIQAAGSMQQAKPLINEYFTRVQNANTYFLSYTEGWKTDRGMIYIIMGKPMRIELDEGSETWTYETYGNQHVKIVFEKVTNPFTENDYQLVRSELLDIPYKTAVESWRSGIIQK